MSGTGPALLAEDSSNLLWALLEVTCTTRRCQFQEVAVHPHHLGLARQCLRSSNNIQATNNTVGLRIIPTMGLDLLIQGLLCLDIHLELTAGPALATFRQDILVIQVANSIPAVGTTPHLRHILSNTNSSNQEWCPLVEKVRLLQGLLGHRGL